MTEEVCSHFTGSLFHGEVKENTDGVNKTPCFLVFSLEEDFVSWREQFWPAICEHFGVEASGDESRCIDGQLIF